MRILLVLFLATRSFFYPFPRGSVLNLLTLNDIKILSWCTFFVVPVKEKKNNLINASGMTFVWSLGKYLHLYVLVKEAPYSLMLNPVKIRSKKNHAYLQWVSMAYKTLCSGSGEHARECACKNARACVSMQECVETMHCLFVSWVKYFFRRFHLDMIVCLRLSIYCWDPTADMSSLSENTAFDFVSILV